MLSGTFCNPTTIHFGKNSVHRALDDIPVEDSRVLVVHGKKAIEQSGLLSLASGKLAARRIFHLTLGGVHPNPTADLVYIGIDLCRKHDINFLLAIGGGSVIDTAKAIAAGVPYDGDFFDFYLGRATPTRALPIGTVVTIAGAGSESNNCSVVTKNGQKYVCSNPTIYPLFAAMDPSYTTSVPRFLTACGVVDAISHVLERYFTSSTAVSTSTELCEGLIRALMHNGEALLDDPTNYDLRAEMMWASKLAHDNTVGFGRKQDWASHTIAHELGARYDAPHGALLAVVFPAWMTFVEHRRPDVFARLANAVFGLQGTRDTELGMAAIAAYRAFLRRIGMPRTLSECIGTDPRDEFESIAHACGNTTASGTIGNFERLPQDDVIDILTLAETGG